MVKCPSICNAGNPGSIPGLRRSPGEGNGSPLQYSCLENPMDRGAWLATAHGVAKSWTQLNNFTKLLVTLIPISPALCPSTPMYKENFSLEKLFSDHQVML